MTEKKFRKDINGLRAIAVISVVLFHYNNNFVPGGFAGVDIFFVISGFLMTGIILTGIDRDNFSIIHFIIRRAKRIAPPLIATVAVSLAICFLFLDPIRYQLSGKHALSSLLFISNIIYNSENGYFDPSSDTKLFLHTWSLSVEWQFYILYPIFIFTLSKIFDYRAISKCIVIAMLASILYCIYSSLSNSSGAYFLLYSRAWEMLAGGISFIIKDKVNDRRTSNLLIITGTLLIVYSFLIYNHNTIWPGYAAITPVLGTCLIITANSKKSFYELPPLQYIGKLSYSIYLIHWPVLIISRDIFQKTNIVYYAIIVLLSSIISYKIIEDRKKVGVYFVIPFFAICAFSYYVSIDGVKNRVDEKFTLSAKEYHHKYYGGFGFANNGGVQYINSSPDKSDFIISGDSYARQYLRFLKNSNRSFISIMKDGCFVSEKYISHFNIEMDNQCISRLNNLTIVMKKYPTKPVVIAQSWKDYTNKISKKDSHVIVSNEKKFLSFYEDYLNEVLKNGGNSRAYYIIGSNFITEGNVAYECLTKASMRNFLSSIAVTSCANVDTIVPEKINSFLKSYAEQHDNVYFLDPNTPLCKGSKCTIITENGEPVLSDGSHMSYFGSEIAGRVIFSQIR